MNTVLDYLVSQSDLRVGTKLFDSHTDALHDFNSRMHTLLEMNNQSDLNPKTKSFIKEQFSSLLKDSFRVMNSFNEHLNFEDSIPLLKTKIQYPLSYLSPKFDSHLKFGKTKIHGCINPISGYPCGKCLYCLENRRVPWTVRLTHERRFWSKFGIPTYFVTLTYDEANLPKDGVSKRDIQLFLKRLRKNYASLESNNLKYFCVSEYGPTTHRAHYHLILFGFNRNLSTALQIISKCWNNGFVKVSRVKPARIKYVTKYSTKFFDKLNDSNSENLDEATSRSHCSPEFRLISKGLGISFISPQNVDYYRNNPDKLFLILDDVKYALPRYYRDKIFDKDDLRFKFFCFEESLKKHLDFISYYFNHLYKLDVARKVNGSLSVFREHYNRDVQRYVDYIKKNAKI